MSSCCPGEPEWSAGLLSYSGGTAGPHPGGHHTHTEVPALPPGETEEERGVTCVTCVTCVCQEMVDNYLTEARLRFEKDRGLKSLQAEERRRRDGKDVRDGRECVSPACGGQGSARTSYLCPQCYQQQLHQTKSHGAQHGSGNSKFYVTADPATFEGLTRLSPCKQATLRSSGDRSLYLANSTFYQEGHIVPVSRSSPSPPLTVPVEAPPCAPRRTRGSSGWREAGLVPAELPDARPCRSSGCTFYGSSDTQQYCSRCFREQQRVPQASRV